MQLILYHTPGTCSRVMMAALEELGLPFEDRPINIFKGGQFDPAYLAVNAKAKVPALLVDGHVLTETPAIILWLTQHVVGDTLLPGTDALGRAQAFSDVVWCSNTLHPLARAIRIPQRMTSGEPQPVWDAAVATMTPLLETIDARLSRHPWWFGEGWSIVDVYVSWIMGMCEGGGMDLSPLPALVAHRSQVRARPSFARALAREAKAMDMAGIILPGGDAL